MSTITGTEADDTLTGTPDADTIDGLAGDDTIDGLAGNDVIDGGSGADTLIGGDGDDTIIVDTNDLVVEAVGGGNDIVKASTSYALSVGAEIETLSTTGAGGVAAIALTGNEFGQTLIGNAGDNYLDGGGGADTLNGLGGNDTYIVGNGADLVVEAVGDGNDLVAATASYALAAGAEIETLSTTYAGGYSAIALTGNEFAQTLIGNAADNYLDGGGGADTLSGLGGNDTYIVDNVGDLVIEAVGGGNDLVGTKISFALNAGAEVEILSTANRFGIAGLTLTGNEFGQTIIGNAGNNYLDGGGGADILEGLGGDDRYVVDADDQVIEVSGAPGGLDRVEARTSYQLNAGAYVETLTTTNGGGFEPIALTGNELGQTILGNAGDNYLSGGGGADYLLGGAGNDTIIVDSANDRIEEAVGGGNDLVATTVSYALPRTPDSEVETLSTTYAGGTAPIALTGNQFAQTLIGNAGVNYLDGGAGADVLNGLGGNDTYIIDNAGDRVIEAVGDGNDIVGVYSSWVLNAGAEVETLATVWSGSATVINLTGNEFGQAVIGNAANNVLDGGAGADSLQGMAGADTFAFTTALGSGNVDAILDFAAALDKIALDDAVFGGIGGLGALDAGAFVTGTGALDADDRVIYDNATGSLYFDADGNGAGAAVQFATLGAGLNLTAGDFLVI